MTGQELHPWQRHVADVALELEPDPDRPELLRLAYRTVVLTVPRQQGKSTLVDALLLTLAERAPWRTVVYAAQDRQSAARRLLEELVARKMDTTAELRGRYRVRRSNGREAVTLWNRSTIAVTANTASAGHGLTIDGAVLDELFAHRDLTVVQALGPAMMTRPERQLWAMSTRGDGTDGALQHFEELGRASLADPTSSLAFFEWSAPDDADRDDPATWAAAMPALGATVPVSEVADKLATWPAPEFDRAYLNRRPSAADTAALPLHRWLELVDATAAPAGPYTLAVDVEPDRSAATVALAGRHEPTGHPFVIVEHRPGVGWVPGLTADMAATYRPAAVVVDRLGAAASLEVALLGRRLPVVLADTRDVVAAAGLLHDLTTGAELRHAGQTWLTDAVAASRRRALGDAWTWNRTAATSPLGPVVAAALAVHRWHELRLGAGRPRIH